jgi:hypothetical protein
MIQLDDIKAFIHHDRNNKFDMILPVITTLISGLVIIISISPEYLRELHPLTLLLLSVASALPVWALNQLLWWYLGRRLSSELVGRIVLILKASGKEKKVLSFALSRLMKAIDIVHVIPSKNIGNLTTVITIYLGAALIYFIPGSIVWLYGSIVILSLFIWIVSLYVLHRTCKKIDVMPLKTAWNQLIKNDELIHYINDQFEKIVTIIKTSHILHSHQRDISDSGNLKEGKDHETN